MVLAEVVAEEAAELGRGRFLIEEMTGQEHPSQEQLLGTLKKMEQTPNQVSDKPCVIIWRALLHLLFSPVVPLLSDNFPSPEDWDNDEYQGSISDTKVFTASNVGGDISATDTIASLTVNNSSTDPSLTTSPGVSSAGLNYAQVCIDSDVVSSYNHNSANSGFCISLLFMFLTYLPIFSVPDFAECSREWKPISSAIAVPEAVARL